MTCNSRRQQHGHQFNNPEADSITANIRFIDAGVATEPVGRDSCGGLIAILDRVL